MSSLFTADNSTSLRNGPPTLHTRLSIRYTGLRIDVPLAAEIIPSGYSVEPPGQALQEETQVDREAQGDEDACYICFTNIPREKFTPCGHAGICRACARKVMQRDTPSCPLCRGEVSSFQSAV